MKINQILDEYIKKWHLAEVKLLQKTNANYIYKVVYKRRYAILKIFQNNSDEKNSYQMLKYYNGAGAVKVLAHDDNAILLEFLSNDISLKKMVIEGQNFEAATIAVEIIKKLHSIKHNQRQLNIVTIEERFRSLFLKSKQENYSRIFIKAADLATIYIKQKQNIKVLHGDIHYDNIIYDKQRGWVAIDPKGILGEQTYDVANLICNPYPLKNLVYNKQRILDLSNFLSQSLNLRQERIIGFAFIHASLASIWAEEEGSDNLYWLNLAKSLDEILSNLNE